MGKETKTSKKKPEKKLTKEQKLKLEVDELKNDLLRSKADFENFRKRVDKERSEIRERTIANFVESILPALDNFEMSLQMTDNQAMFVKGVEMIHKNLIDILNENKIQEFIPKIGDKFDPKIHDPVLVEDESKNKGEVLAVLKKGYKHKDSILRSARVQVKKE